MRIKRLVFLFLTVSSVSGCAHLTTLNITVPPTLTLQGQPGVQLGAAITSGHTRR